MQTNINHKGSKYSSYIMLKQLKNFRKRNFFFTISEVPNPIFISTSLFDKVFQTHTSYLNLFYLTKYLVKYNKQNFH